MSVISFNHNLIVVRSFEFVRVVERVGVPIVDYSIRGGVFDEYGDALLLFERRGVREPSRQVYVFHASKIREYKNSKKMMALPSSTSRRCEKTKDQIQ